MACCVIVRELACIWFVLMFWSLVCKGRRSVDFVWSWDGRGSISRGSPFAIFIHTILSWVWLACFLCRFLLDCLYLGYGWLRKDT